MVAKAQGSLCRGNGSSELRRKILGLGGAKESSLGVGESKNGTVEID